MQKRGGIDGTRWRGWGCRPALGCHIRSCTVVPGGLQYAAMTLLLVFSPPPATRQHPAPTRRLMPPRTMCCCRNSVFTRFSGLLRGSAASGITHAEIEQVERPVYNLGGGPPTTPAHVLACMRQTRRPTCMPYPAPTKAHRWHRGCCAVQACALSAAPPLSAVERRRQGSRYAGLHTGKSPRLKYGMARNVTRQLVCSREMATHGQRPPVWRLLTLHRCRSLF